MTREQWHAILLAAGIFFAGNVLGYTLVWLGYWLRL